MSNTPVSYILCSNPRSGTTLLCDLLAQTGVAGKPDSFFRQKSLQDWCDHWGITQPFDKDDPGFTKIYFDAMRCAGSDGTPVFGLRLMGPDLQFAQDWLARVYSERNSDHDRFDAAFGPVCYVHLSRQDKLAEAVSYLRAEQTGLWHGKPDGSDLERIAPQVADGYDGDALRARVEMLADYDQAWEAWFAAEGVTPLRLTYENLAKDSRKTLAQVLSFIGQDPKLADGTRPGVRKLADATSVAWIARYRVEYRGS